MGPVAVEDEELAHDSVFGLSVHPFLVIQPVVAAVAEEEEDTH